MAFETILLEHVPSMYTICAAFFKEVSNAEFLQSRLLARDSDFEYAFIDASSVISKAQILTATYKALTALLDGTLRTPNVHSEIVLALNSSMNIAEAYRRWGINPLTRDMIVIKVLSSDMSTSTAQKSASDVWAHLETHVKGVPVPLTDAELRTSTDWAKLRKYYKLGGAKALEQAKDEEEKRIVAEALILSAMALRGV